MSDAFNKLIDSIIISTDNPYVFYFYGTKDYFDLIEEKFGVIIPDKEKIILPKKYIPEEEDYRQWWEIINE